MSPSLTPITSASRVLIIGGGISGLALGQSLHQARIPFTIFERDLSSGFRPQGYRISHTPQAEKDLLDMVGDELFRGIRGMGTGQGDRGLPNKVLFVDAASGQDLDMMKLFGGGGKGGKGGDKKPEGTGPPNKQAQGKHGGGPPPGMKEAPDFKSDRTVLRGMLGMHIEDSISYGKRFVNFTSQPSGTVTARFEDGSEETGALIIGSDGVRSKVHSALRRHQALPPPALLDLGRRAIYGKTLLTPEFRAAFPEKWRSTTTLIRDGADPDKWLFQEPVIFINKAEDSTGGKVKTPADYLYWAFLTKSEDYGLSDAELFALKPAQIAALSLKMTEGWDPLLRLPLERQDLSETSMLGIQSAHPDIPSRPSHPSVTLMGDAVHAMAPTGGNGANTAIRDAALLSKSLKEKWDPEAGWKEGTISSLVKEYEAEMMDNGRKVLDAAFQTIFAKLMMGGKEPDEYERIEVRESLPGSPSGDIDVLRPPL